MRRQVLAAPVQNFEVTSVILAETSETIVIGPKWTQNKTSCNHRNSKRLSLRCWREFPRSTGDTLLAKVGESTDKGEVGSSSLFRPEFAGFRQRDWNDTD
jgi:hypothetical protein